MTKHTYTNGGWSKLDYKMDNFWKWLQTFLPNSLSPNYITLSGGFFLISAVTLIWTHDSTLSGKLPTWLYVYGAFCIFMLQTLDALDGKHARVTGQSSMLGQFLDHGLDSTTNSFMILIMLQSNLFGGGFCTFLVQFLTHFLYFLHSWEEYHTGVFSTQVDEVGGTEFQLQIIAITLLPVFFSHDTLQHKIILNMNVPEIITCVLVISAFLHIYSSLKIINKKIKPEAYKDLVPIVFIGLAEGLLFFTNIWKTRTLELIVFNGVIYGFYCLKYIICIMTKKPYQVISIDYLLYLIAIIISLVVNDLQVDNYLFGGLCSIIMIRYVHYFVGVSIQLKDFLGISF